MHSIQRQGRFKCRWWREKISAIPADAS